MQSFNFPIQFRFKISTLANDFVAKDRNGQVLAYVYQKMFKLKEEILVYADESKRNVNYTIRADRWLDFSAVYSFADANGKELGKVARKGWRSMWKAEYSIVDDRQSQQYLIREENAWVRVLDGLVGEIPVAGLFTGYVFNPTYVVTNNQGQLLYRLKKQPSFFGREFKVDKLGGSAPEEDERVLLGLMMMILLERHRG